ncbi:hypothetical protein PHYBLDRAFT_73177 [Phycomyces blakesleeanus NRRL 1555(-)]|uniref:Uncharacterized protein n=1 Tax=Phycomyces blakesleeanus (strain ATCC 8743b / DSM 1359 / FGSC 10004 / NBRC 33097 / NRRL 1555) TaxID=763407 RepID=A0A162TBX5_PHYB8|nr:hypothetical protein PHYBLDRAFT_73177 [Phycomyces blakesleeanus NRRL 1555(-)]OAD65893.1 hypothetical protein PHYBLDRAFT_73177 [Phycomyces blakesleeanus NRRL 1555(-)]|eukprot:XP_018283933.1 hypothetical protein PHYBLDRAFT_73177 [Phycomyces blakesleeanus NRRL 1555(-)]
MSKQASTGASPFQQNIQVNIQKARERQQKYYNKNRKERQHVKVGDVVNKIKPKETWKLLNARFTGLWSIKKITYDKGASCQIDDLHKLYYICDVVRTGPTGSSASSGVGASGNYLFNTQFTLYYDKQH